MYKLIILFEYWDKFRYYYYLIWEYFKYASSSYLEPKVEFQIMFHYLLMAGKQINNKNILRSEIIKIE